MVIKVSLGILEIQVINGAELEFRDLFWGVVLDKKKRGWAGEVLCTACASFLLSPQTQLPLIYFYCRLCHVEGRPLKPKSELFLFPSPISISNSLSRERLNWLPSPVERNISFWKLAPVNEVHTSEFCRRQKSHERQLKEERKEMKCRNPLKNLQSCVQSCEIHWTRGMPG